MAVLEGTYFHHGLKLLLAVQFSKFSMLVYQCGFFCLFCFGLFFFVSAMDGSLLSFLVSTSPVPHSTFLLGPPFLKTFQIFVEFRGSPYIPVAKQSWENYEVRNRLLCCLSYSSTSFLLES